MITLQEICEYLNPLLQLPAFNDFGINGLQVEGRTKVSSIATAVSASLATLNKAADAGVDLLIVHHGIFWQRDDPVIRGTKRRKLQLLLENEISLLAYHLPLDAHHEFGNNWVAALQLGWSHLEPFGVYDGMAIGVKGCVPLQSREEFQKRLESYYRHPAHAALGGKEMVASAALISGGAHKSILDAAKAGVDCFVTGSFDEPVWHQAFEEGINFFALGHASTEEVGPRTLGQHLQHHFNLPVTFLAEHNPF